MNDRYWEEHLDNAHLGLTDGEYNRWEAYLDSMQPSVTQRALRTVAYGLLGGLALAAVAALLATTVAVVSVLAR